jgi:hypothetical protein
MVHKEFRVIKALLAIRDIKGSLERRATKAGRALMVLTALKGTRGGRD